MYRYSYILPGQQNGAFHGSDHYWYSVCRAGRSSRPQQCRGSLEPVCKDGNPNGDEYHVANYSRTRVSTW